MEEQGKEGHALLPGLKSKPSGAGAHVSFLPAQPQSPRQQPPLCHVSIEPQCPTRQVGAERLTREAKIARAQGKGIAGESEHAQGGNQKPPRPFSPHGNPLSWCPCRELNLQRPRVRRSKLYTHSAK
jgi:hypothetical protein